MNENTVTVPRDEYNALVWARFTVDLLKSEHETMTTYDFFNFAGKLLGLNDDAEGE